MKGMKLTVMHLTGNAEGRLRFKFKNGLQLSIYKNCDETYDVMAIASDGKTNLTDHFCSISNVDLFKVNWAIEAMEEIKTCSLCGNTLIDKETQNER